MIIKIAEDADILNLKKSIKHLLTNGAGAYAFNQRYGREFNYTELSDSIDRKQTIWVAYSVDGEVVGYAELSKKEKSDFELGYIIFPRYQRLGYGHKIAHYAFKDCKNLLNIHKLKIEAEDNNVGSIKIMNKLKEEFPIHNIEIYDKYDPNTLIYTWSFD